ncbi:MAG: adenylyltransferase/cytidyltransferase family protein [Halobacteriales archaeon]
MKRVMAQGTFDILHPGHVHYLEESAALGDELAVVIARDSRVATRKDVFLDEETRRRVVAALGAVDDAVLGSEEDLFASVAEIEPDVITLGHDQGYDVDDLAADLAAAGFEGIEVVRIGPYDGPGVTSSSDVKDRILARFGSEAFESTAGE